MSCVEPANHRILTQIFNAFFGGPGTCWCLIHQAVLIPLGAVDRDIVLPQVVLACFTSRTLQSAGAWVSRRAADVTMEEWTFALDECSSARVHESHARQRRRPGLPQPAYRGCKSTTASFNKLLDRPHYLMNAMRTQAYPGLSARRLLIDPATNKSGNSLAPPRHDDNGQLLFRWDPVSPPQPVLRCYRAPCIRISSSTSETCCKLRG